MIYSIVCDRIDDPSLPPGYFYARIAALDLTTHGRGIEGAKAAALDLLKLCVAEKAANGESLPVEHECCFSKLEIADAVHGA